MIDEMISDDVRGIIHDFGTDRFLDDIFLVTGGAGFIGSYLCDTLALMGAEVICVDNFCTGLRKNIDHLLQRENFQLIEGDICTFNEERKFDYILHFSSRASPEEYQANPIETLLANSLGAYRVLELARKSGSRILLASSSEVYGDAKIVPTPESYWGNVNPVGVRSCYDEGKRFAEALFMAYYRRYGLDVRIVRIHNTYGPRLRAEGKYARALSRFVLQGLKSENLTVFGNGTQTRSFCYITDTVLGILLTLSTERLMGEVINIGSEKEISILELAMKVKEIIGSDSQIAFCSLPEDDPRRRRPDISKAKRLLKWTPKVSLEEGLGKIIRWMSPNFRI